MVRVGAAHVEGAECVTVLQSPDYYRLHRVHAEVLYIVLEDGTENVLTDSASYSLVVSPASPEDTFQSKYL